MMSSVYISCRKDKIRRFWKGWRDTIRRGDHMKKTFLEISLSILIGVIVPGILLSLILPDRKGPAPMDASQGSTDMAANPSEPEDSETMIPVIMSDESVQEMKLDTYITGVVLAEMPAEFDEEALKAQAVVARTFTLKRLHSAAKHDRVGICTDPACCQAYISAEEYLAREGQEENLQKVENAVFQTSEQVLTYEGSLIEATYFSCSGGKTEDAMAVWGSEIPYLQAKDSPGEERAAHYIDTVTFSKEDFLSRLGGEFAAMENVSIGTVTHTEGGGVETIEICGNKMSGTEVRKRLGLRSTAFIMTSVGSSVTVTTKGFGHRVGMSQYGADAMAVNGSGYEEILSYYYPGTTLQKSKSVDKE